MSEKREWVAIEYEIVSKMALAGKNDAEIGAMLNRSDRQVYLARKKMGIVSKNSNTNNPWSIEDIKVLTAWYNMGRSDVEIAQALNRTRDSVAGKRQSIGLERAPAEKATRYTRPVHRGVQAAEVLAQRPLLPTDDDYTRRAYANAAFLISLLRADHRPGDGERREGDKPHPYALYLSGAPVRQLVGA